MQSFKFRLQSVLDYQQGLVDRMRFQVAALQSRLTQETLRLENLRTAERQAVTELDRGSGPVLELPRIVQIHEHLHILSLQIAEQSAVVQHVRADLEMLRHNLLELTKEAKTLEKLRERQAEEFAAEGRRLERIETSELAALRFQRAQLSP